MRTLVACGVLLITAVLTGRAMQGPPPDVAARAQGVIARLAAKDFVAVEAQFNDRMKAALPPGGLEASWSQLTAQAGPFQRCCPGRARSVNGMDVVVLPCDFARAAIDAQVVFDPSGKIAARLVRPAAAASPP